MTEQNQNEKKMPYAPPELRVYGDVRTITQHSDRGQNRDGGQGDDRRS